MINYEKIPNTLNGNTNAVNHILLGDGKGNFTNEILVSKGIDIHESEMADLHGEGDLDILGKPFNGDVPRLDVWLQNGTGEQVSKRSGSFTQPFGLELYSFRFQFKNDVPGLAKIKDMGIKDIEISDYNGYSPKEFKKLIDKNNLKCSSMVSVMSNLKRVLIT